MKRLTIAVAIMLLAAFQGMCQKPETALQKACGAKLVDAIAAYDSGNLDKSMEYLTAILDADPENDAAYYYLGLCHLGLRENKKAQQFLAAAAKIDSTNYWYLYNLGVAYVSSGDGPRSLQMFNVIKKRFPTNPDSYYILSRIYGSLRRYDDMNDINEQIYTRFGGSPEILTSMGDYQMSQANDTLALKYYNEALSMDPADPAALLGASEVNRVNGRPAEFFSQITQFAAMPDVRSAAKVNYFRQMFGRINGKYLQDNQKSFDTVVDTLMVVHPHDTVACPFAASYYYATGRLRKVCDIAGAQAEAWPDELPIQVSYIEILILTKQYTAAKEYATKVSRRFPKADVIPQMLGDLAYQQGDSKEAYKQYEKALKLNPDNIVVLNNYAYYLSEDGKALRKAYKMSEKTIKAEPDNATYLDTFGWILHLMGKDAEAKPVFKHAMLYGGKESSTILSHYAKVLESLGESDLAKVYFNMASARQKVENQHADE